MRVEELIPLPFIFYFALRTRMTTTMRGSYGRVVPSEAVTMFTIPTALRHKLEKLFS